MKMSSAVFLIMGYLSNHQGETVLIADIAENTHLHRDTVSKRVKELISAGYLLQDGRKYKVLRDIGKE